MLRQSRQTLAARWETLVPKVKGIYDGAKVILLEPLAIPPHTPVEVWITEGTLDAEQVYWQRLVDLPDQGDPPPTHR